MPPPKPNDLKVLIKRVDKELPLPVYETDGSVGFDLICRETVHIKPGWFEKVHANVIVKTPPGYMLMIAYRSSTPARYGLIMPNAIGVIDQDFCGEEDELIIPMYNFTDAKSIVRRGAKIALGWVSFVILALAIIILFVVLQPSSQNATVGMLVCILGMLLCISIQIHFIHNEERSNKDD